MAEKQNKETKEKRVKVFVPRGASNEDPNVFVSVNGVNYLLPKGKESEVPVAVANEYYRSLAAQELAGSNRERLQREQQAGR